jgi:peptidoglycan/xylan/chitin deacetylase (PgdA/CDA1 family)
MATRLILSALVAVAAASPIASLQSRDAALVYAGCTKPGVVALTFDDGPYMYTDTVLDHLNAAGMHATFFVNGQNWANIFDYADTVKRVVDGGHQIGSHT